jgi:hypothetical protein
MSGAKYRESYRVQTDEKCQMLVLNAYQLLPGEACPEYAYRYRFLGRVSMNTHKHTWTEELLACFEEAHVTKRGKNKIKQWILDTADKLLHTGRTGWDSCYGLNFVLERVSAASDTRWSWDFCELRRTQQEYIKKN